MHGSVRVKLLLILNFKNKPIFMTSFQNSERKIMWTCKYDMLNMSHELKPTKLFHLIWIILKFKKSFD
jgi:hypothetical protein